MYRFTTLSLLAVAVLPITSSQAAIQSVSGQVTQIGAPASSLPGALTSFNASAWNEQTNVTTGPIKVNLIAPGFYTGPGANAAVVAGTFDSHFIHFDPVVGQFNASGTVTFVDPIAAIIYENTYLDGTDAIFGSFGTLYDTGNPNRSFAGALNNSSISWAGNTLTFNLWSMVPGNPICELRVLTHPVPAPGSLALLGLGGLAACRRRRTSASVA
jgi:hypothetical protein